MKIIAVNRRLGRPVESLHDFELYPDSAPVASGKPVFVPDWFDKGYAAVLAPAYRIGRLGKAIKPRFVWRYIDAVSLSARIYPLNSPVIPGICRPMPALAWDGSLVFGKWLDAVGESDGRDLRIAAEASPGLTLPLRGEDIDIEGIVADVSAIMTLKTGDIIMPCYLEPEMSLTRGDTVTYRLNDVSDALMIKVR